MPTKPTILTRAHRWANLLPPALWSMLSVPRPKKAGTKGVPTKPATSTASAMPPAPEPHLQQRGSLAASSQTSSTSTAAAHDPDAELLDGVPAVLAARDRERARCAAIVDGPAGQAHPVLAQKLAFETRLSVDEAVQVLASTPAPPDRAALSAARAARNPQVGSGGEIHRPREQVLAAGWDRAFAAVNGAAPAAHQQDQRTPGQRS